MSFPILAKENFRKVRIMDTNFFERLEALNAKKAELQKEYDAIRADALEVARNLTKQFALSATEVGCGAAAIETPKTRKPVEPKYQNPAGEETWTGRGVKPVWFKQALEAGITAEEMLIKKA